MTVGQLRERITPYELILWAEFYQREKDAIIEIQERSTRRMEH